MIWGGGELRAAWMISSSETVMPKRRYARSSRIFWMNWCNAILQLPLVLAGQPPASLLAAILLQGRLILLLERLGAHDGAVHLEDDVPSPADDIADLPVRHPTNERDRHDPEDRLRDLTHRAHHKGPDSDESMVGGA